ncbi:MAG: outer membrane beta-barrel family protein, partial [Bacteroidota bacterium]|nr:outer membrane beta-barrel family protein [Bacteroidota bacterium]
YQVRFKKTSLRTGLRAEQTIVDGEFTSSKTTVHQQYLNLVPNFLLSRKFSSAYTFSVAYNLRLHRPSISNLNPFVNNNDSLNISFGNPALEPQTLHTVSLQNRIAVGGFFLSLSFNGSYSDNLIVQFADFNNVTGVTRITNANVGKENQASVGLTVNAPISEKFNFNLNTQLRYNKIENTSNLLQRREGFSGSAAGNFHYKLVGKFTISGSGGVSKSPYAFVNSPSLQGFYQVNFGQKLFAEKLALTVNVNNFHQAFLQFRTVTENSNFRATTINSNPYRVIYFGATYNFGKLKEEVSKKKGVSNDDTIQ